MIIFLVLRTSDGNYITNGNFSVSPSGIYEAAAAQFDYRRLDSLLINVTDYLGQDDESVTEWITSTGPTNEDVQLLVSFGSRTIILVVENFDLNFLLSL